MRVPVTLLIWLCAPGAAATAAAQVRSTPEASPADQEDEPSLLGQRAQGPLAADRAGSNARTSLGQVGQRQTREVAAEQVGIKPMARIANRVQNRINNRIRNRVDRNYDPQGNPANPFAIAEDQVRTTGQPR
jgi:hypothetical protein